MNYQTGDYIRFHTPEQWQQIVEKLERDGQQVYNPCFKENIKAAFKGNSKTWCRVYNDEDYLPEATQDITDKFFEELLQEDLCSNPPLEVGDEFTISCTLMSDTGAIEIVDNETCKITSRWDVQDNKIIPLSVLKGKLSGSYFNIEYGSYKQANPVQEYSVKAKKRLISLSGKACPRYYRLKVDNETLKELLDQGFKLNEYDDWYFTWAWSVNAPYRIELDMADKTIYANRYVLSKKRSIAIKTIKSMEGVSDLYGSLEKLDMISDNEHSILIAEAINEEEYQKWLKCVESHHEMMLESEKEYREECFKVIEEIK